MCNCGLVQPGTQCVGNASVPVNERTEKHANYSTRTLIDQRVHNALNWHPDRTLAAHIIARPMEKGDEIIMIRINPNVSLQNNGMRFRLFVTLYFKSFAQPCKNNIFSSP